MDIPGTTTCLLFSFCTTFLLLGVQVDATVVEILFLMYCFLTINVPNHLREGIRKYRKCECSLGLFLKFLCPLNNFQSMHFIIIVINNTKTYLTRVKYSNEKKINDFEIII